MTTGVRIVEDAVPFRGHRTWYRVTGPIDGGAPPLVLLHGGPGAAHDYLDTLGALASTERAVIHYDQIGCGRSTHLPDAAPSFWTVQLFLDELDALLGHLGISGCYDLLGQSWGGMLAGEHAVRRPAGLRRLIIADSPASMRTWVREADRLRAALPHPVQATLLRHEQAGSTGSAEYQAAVRVFYDRHVCRIPWPDGVAASFAQIEADPTVYHTMNGPSEFHCIGTLKDWTIEARLHLIAVPTLLIAGRYDEATPEVIRPWQQSVPDIRTHVFDNSSHMPHVEEEAACLAVVAEFLA
jgi:L-proline amide hydrolase